MYFKASAGIMGLSTLNDIRLAVALRTKALAWAGPFALCMTLLIGCSELDEATYSIYSDGWRHSFDSETAALLGQLTARANWLLKQHES